MHIFIDRGNLLKGSARIYGRNLNNIFEEHGIKTDLIMLKDCLSSQVTRSLCNEATSILIGKGITLSEIEQIHKLNKSAAIGTLHPSISDDGKKRLEYSNFSVVGSTTERNNILRLKLEKPIFMVPQIEFFSEFEYKSNYISCPIFNNDLSDKKKKIVLMWHGEGGHLANFPKNLVTAINDLAEQMSLQIIFVTNHNKYLPRLNCDVVFRKYSEKVISDTLKEANVGIVTSLNYQRKAIFLYDKKTQKYKGDLISRYKTVSNPARAFLFLQHGIPFVCDENPEHFIFNDIENKILCSSTESWYQNILEASENKKISQWQINLFKRFHQYGEIINYIREIHHNF